MSCSAEALYLLLGKRLEALHETYDVDHLPDQVLPHGANWQSGTVPWLSLLKQTLVLRKRIGLMSALRLIGALVDGNPLAWVVFAQFPDLQGRSPEIWRLHPGSPFKKR